jgi:hypothetical protein
MIVVVGAVTKVILTFIKRPRHGVALPADLAERLERIERAVDTTAIEVERIGEGQRFLTRTLGERAVADPKHPDASGRIVTPN